MKNVIGVRVLRMRTEGKKGIRVVRGEVVTNMRMTKTRTVRYRIEVIMIETERGTERGIEGFEVVKGEEKMIMVTADATIGTFPYSVLTLPGMISRTETQRVGGVEDRGMKEKDNQAETEKEIEKEVEEEGTAVMTGIGTEMIGVIDEEEMMSVEGGMETRVRVEAGVGVGVEVEAEVEKEVEDVAVTVTVDHGLGLIRDLGLGPGHHRGPVGVGAGVTVRARVWTAEMRRRKQ